MRETRGGPEVRVRIKHTQTAKGWRLDETTVEITRPVEMDATEIDSYAGLMHAELYAAHQDGRDEAARRNAQDGFT